MKATLSIVIVVVLLLAALAFFQRPQNSHTPFLLPNPTPTPTPTVDKVDIKASFTIITGGITRSFKAEKYHNQSPDVYIEASDPTLVHVTKIAIIWDDFFKTLPMKLTKECLTTGDGETFCDGKDGSLKFYLNGVEDKDLLQKEIKEQDRVLIKYAI